MDAPLALNRRWSCRHRHRWGHHWRTHFANAPAFGPWCLDGRRFVGGGAMVQIWRRHWLPVTVSFILQLGRECTYAIVRGSDSHNFLAFSSGCHGLTVMQSILLLDSFHMVWRYQRLDGWYYMWFQGHRLLDITDHSRPVCGYLFFYL